MDQTTLPEAVATPSAPDAYPQSLSSLVEKFQSSLAYALCVCPNGAAAEERLRDLLVTTLGTLFANPRDHREYLADRVFDLMHGRFPGDDGLLDLLHDMPSADLGPLGRPIDEAFLAYIEVEETAEDVVSILKTMSGNDGWRAAWRDILGFDHVEHWNDVLQDAAHPMRDLVCSRCGRPRIDDDAAA